jgi:hypothetical protein
MKTRQSGVCGNGKKDNLRLSNFGDDTGSFKPMLSTPSAAVDSAMDFVDCNNPHQ